MIAKQLFGSLGVVALFVSMASAQVETANPSGPTITIDVERVAGPGSRPAIDPLTGGLTFIIGVTPDDSFPPFSDSGAGPLGPGGSVAVELGFLISGDGFSDAVPAPTDILPSEPDGLVVVNLNNSPGVGSTATETDDGFVDFANPGNGFFDFEVPVFDLNSDGTPDLPAGIQVGIDGSTDQDALFAALGTTFFDASTIGDAPFELFRIRTAAVDLTSPDAVAPSLTLVAGSITAQVTDFDGGIPVSEVFQLPVTQSEVFTTADIIPEPATGVVIVLAVGAVGLTRQRRNY